MSTFGVEGERLMTECRFGYVEYDGYQYCFEHCGWHHYTDRVMRRCDRAFLDLADGGGS